MSCEHCAHVQRVNLAILKHEAEMWMSDHDENGRCCLFVKLAAWAEEDGDGG